MALKDDKIKDLFASKLQGFEPEVPASVWGGLDQLLSQQPPLQTPDTSSSTASNASSSTAGSAAKTTAIKIGMTAIGVAATVAVGVFIAYNSDEIPTIAPIVENAEIIAPETKIEEFADNTLLLAEADFAPKRSRKVVAKEETTFAAEPVLESTPVLADSEVKEIPKAARFAPKTQNEEAVEELPPLPSFLKEDLSLSLRGSAGAFSSGVDRRGGDLLFSKNQRSQEFSAVLQEENKVYELDHKQPVSVGLTVSKHLSRKFSLETGLMFTYLSSKIKSNSAVGIKEEQEFGYLGIPIYLNYTFLELRRARFYVSLGAMAQKDIYGKYTSKLGAGENLMRLSNTTIPDYVLYAEPSYIKQNISQSNWQFSTHFSVGASYPIYRKLNVYGTVGGAYYFDAGNEYRTIYTDRNFQLDLNLGFRFDF